MRNGTLPAMAGKPPADAAHPSGMNGMIVTVPRNAPQEPRAPRIPSRLYQNPRNKRSEEHTSELQSRLHLVCRLLLEKKKTGDRLAPASNRRSHVDSQEHERFSPRPLSPLSPLSTRQRWRLPAQDHISRRGPCQLFRT